MTKRGVAYVRVSTEEQAKDDKYGIPSQINDIRRYCEKNDIVIDDDDWYIEEGVSGASRVRPELSKILSDEVHNPPIECIVVAKADRISRDVTTYYVYKDLLARKNIDIVSVKEDWGSADKITATILEGFMAIMADVERETIRMRTEGGRKTKARNGGYAGGNAPYGYRIENGGYVIDEKEAEVVRFVFDLHDQGISNNQITNILNEQTEFKPRSGKKFYSGGIGTMIHNRKTYNGWYRYGEIDWVKGVHEPILHDYNPK